MYDTVTYSDLATPSQVSQKQLLRLIQDGETFTYRCAQDMAYSHVLTLIQFHEKNSAVLWTLFYCRLRHLVVG